MPCGKYRFSREADRIVSADSYIDNFPRDDKTARIYLFAACELKKYLYVYPVSSCREFVFRCLSAALSAVYRHSITKCGIEVSNEVNPEIADLTFLGIAVMQCECFEMWYEALAYSIEILYKYSNDNSEEYPSPAVLEVFAEEFVFNRYGKEVFPDLFMY